MCAGDRYVLEDVCMVFGPGKAFAMDAPAELPLPLSHAEAHELELQVLTSEDSPNGIMLSDNVDMEDASIFLISRAEAGMQPGEPVRRLLKGRKRVYVTVFGPGSAVAILVRLWGRRS